MIEHPSSEKGFINSIRNDSVCKFDSQSQCSSSNLSVPILHVSCNHGAAWHFLNRGQYSIVGKFASLIKFQSA
jgi:hypothetical protein